MIHSPLRYVGGKFYARALILEQLPAHTFYVEPFAGGASIFFAKPKVKRNWLNDIDTELINCLTIIRDRPTELITSLSGELATKERHHYYKYLHPVTTLERAQRWYYLNRTSYSGIMNMQNCYWGYNASYSMQPQNWPRAIISASTKLQGVELTCLDYTSVLNRCPKGAFLFIDPPYFKADQSKFYTHAFTLTDHNKLATTLLQHRGDFKFLLTYDDCPEIRSIYSWAALLSKSWNYTVARADDQSHQTRQKGFRHKGTELFILNYRQEI